MDKLMGLLKVKVVRGVNLAKRDARGSDPYVVVSMGSQKVKTSVKKKSVNPEWNEELTLSVTDSSVPIKLCYCKAYEAAWKAKEPLRQLNRFYPFKDEELLRLMGVTEFTIHDLADVAKMDLRSIPDGTVVKTLHPTKQNLLVCETHITVKNGKVFQALILRLKNVDSGDIHLELQWVNVPPSTH